MAAGADEVGAVDDKRGGGMSEDFWRYIAYLGFVLVLVFLLGGC